MTAPLNEKAQLHKDPWVMQRVATALDAIRYADREGLEAELDLLAFTEEVLDHYGVVIPPGVTRGDGA